MGPAAYPRTGLCSVPGTKFISGFCCVQHPDRSQLLYHKIYRRLKTEILKAVCKEQLILYSLPPPLFNDPKLCLWSSVPLFRHTDDADTV